MRPIRVVDAARLDDILHLGGIEESLVPLSGVLAIAGGLSILLGYHTKLGGRLLVLFLVPVTLMMHKFWTVQDP